MGQTDLFPCPRVFFRPESAPFYGNWHFWLSLGRRRRWCVFLRAAWETSFEVVVDRVCTRDTAFRRLAHVLVKGQVADIVVGVRQHDGVFQAFADRGDLTQAGQQVSHQLTVLRHFSGIEEARHQISAGGHVGRALFIEGQRAIRDAGQALLFVHVQVDGDALEGSFQRADRADDGSF